MLLQTIHHFVKGLSTNEKAEDEVGTIFVVNIRISYIATKCLQGILE
jgi:hypothetical protein